MRDYYIYILECTDGSYYTGITNDLDRRISEHQTGIDIFCYTFHKRPVKLVYSESYIDVLDAIAREKQLKNWSHSKKKALIEKHWGMLEQLAKGHKGYLSKKNPSNPESSSN